MSTAGGLLGTLRASLREADPRFIIPTASFTCYCIYKRYEPASPLYNAVLLLLVPIALAQQMAALPTLTQQLAALWVYWGLILALTVTYRLSLLHPLARFPGPRAMRVSKLYLSYLAVRGDGHHVLRRLHEQYGDVVRVGPNELSFNRGDAVQPILAAKQLPKGPFYDTRASPEGRQLDGMRDFQMHAVRRKPWARAMNIPAIKGYEELIVDKVEQLMSQFAKRQGEALDVATWLNYFGYDFMGRLAFGREFGALEKGQDVDNMLHMMDEAVVILTFVAHIPWVLPFLQAIPGLDKELRKFKLQCTKLAAMRVKEGSSHKDLWFHLTDEGGEGQGLTTAEAIDDGMLAVIAGSDTTAIALAHLVYFFIRDPGCYQKLREEVDAVFPNHQSPYDFSRIAEMPYLNGCINEALRLMPPVLGGLQRQVEEGSGGATIGPYFVPEGTNVFVHQFSLMRNAEEFSPIPDTFWPDRWLDQETYSLPSGKVIHKDKVILNRTSFLPFSAGPQNCIGKNLALQEMRAVCCAIVQRFDLQVAKGYDLDEWERSCKERYITTRGPLMVNLSSRK